MLNRVTAQLNAAHQGQATQGDQGRGENESNSESFSFSGYFSRLMRSNPEMVGVFSTFEKYIPFVLILVTKQLFDHSTGKNNNHTLLKVQFLPKNFSFEFLDIKWRFGTVCELPCKASSSKSTRASLHSVLLASSRINR